MLHRNDAGRLHCENGPALAYPDGFSIWSINGVRVDEQIVMRPETQSLEQLRSEQNAEIKRVRIERFGWLKYLKKNKATVLDFRRNEIEQTDESLMRCDDSTVFIGACPSTGRIYPLEVPPDTRTCDQAQRYLCSGSTIAAMFSNPRSIGRT